MKPFIHGKWHAWQGTAHILLSDESEKKLREFKDTDACINWLYLEGEKEASRALNAHVKFDPERRTVDHLSTLPLAEALWWFIENVEFDAPERTAAFFYLRERVREGK